MSLNTTTHPRRSAVLATSATGPHPFPSRTRSLSLSAPMVLPLRGGGRVGRRQRSMRSPLAITGAGFAFSAPGADLRAHVPPDRLHLHPRPRRRAGGGWLLGAGVQRRRHVAGGPATADGDPDNHVPLGWTNANGGSPASVVLRLLSDAHPRGSERADLRHADGAGDPNGARRPSGQGQEGPRHGLLRPPPPPRPPGAPFS